MKIKALFNDYQKYLEKPLVISGWVRNVRSSKGVAFIELNDGSDFRSLQVVFDNKLKNFLDLENINLGSALEVHGILIKSPAPKQPFELSATEIIVLSLADEDYPLQKKQRPSLEYLRSIAHVRPRANTFMAVFRLRSALSQAIHNFFNDRGFVYVHTPIISTSDCEGAGEMFTVNTFDLKNVPLDKEGEVDFGQDFFGKKAGLTVSGQLNAEALGMAFGDVYTFSPTFRAENSNTTRHASEFWMLEPEIYFADLKDDMKLAEDLLKYLIKYVLTNLPVEMDFFNQFIDTGLIERLRKLETAEFKTISYTEAIDLLLKSKKKFEFPVKWGIDLQTEHERYLTDEVFAGPVFVIDYPKDFKAFYMRLNDDGKTVAAMDLLVPGVGEIIGGSQREERLDILQQRMLEMKLNPQDYQWYLDLRRFGGVRHAGFGLGFERLVMYLSGMANIRDVIPFPRTPKNAEY